MSQDSTGTSVMAEGRIVWTPGDLWKGKLKLDQNTRQPRLNKKGEQMTEYGFGLAVPKTSMAQGGPNAGLWEAAHTEAFKIFPSRQIPPAFAWKYKDGDGVDHNGASFATRPGHAGALVFACTTTMPIKFFKWINGAYVQVSDGIKCGDYVRVQLQVVGHASSGGNAKPGLYINPNMVLFLQEGDEIINTPAPDQMFGAQPAAAGISIPALTQPPTGAPMPGMAPPAPGYHSQAAVAHQPPPQAAPVQPHWGVLPPTHQPPPQAAPASHPYGVPTTPMPATGQATNAFPSNPGFPPLPGR